MSSRRANHEGSVWKRADGRWSGACYVPKAGGGEVRRYVYGATRAEAHAKLVALQGQAERGIPVPTTKQTLAQYLEEWLEEIARPRLRPKTYVAYRSHIRRHIVPSLGKRRLGKLTARDVRRMLDDSSKRGLSPRSVQYVHATLRTALEHAVRDEQLPRNVAKLVSPPRPQPPEREPFTVEEVRQLLRASRDDRLHAAYVVATTIGLRRGELLGLRWEDVDLEKGVLRVRQTLQRHDGGLIYLPPKTPRSRRTVPLPSVSLDALREHREHQDRERTFGHGWNESGLVFTTPIGTAIDPRNFTRMFQDLCQAAGLRSVRLHDLRHTCVSLLLALGIHPRVVMEIVGHSAIEMTMNVYGHVALEPQREALDRLANALDTADWDGQKAR